MKNNFTIGVISDTHSLLRAEALTALEGSDLIIHAGDIGQSSIISSLENIAPVKAVRGNTDRDASLFQYPLTEVLEAQGNSIYIYHGHLELDIDPNAGGFDLVITGHTHQPKIDTHKSVTYFNPGSAGPKRFSLPVSVGKLTISNGLLVPELIYLDL